MDSLLSISPSPRKAQIPQRRRWDEAPVFQVPAGSCAPEGHGPDGADAHGDRGEAPEIGHQPGKADRKRGRDALAAHGGNS